ncbi:MAG: hypothetical protein ACF8PN_05230 [Phycisphaerales bacterium]
MPPTESTSSGSSSSSTALFVRLLWLGPLVMVAGVSLAMVVAWGLGRAFGFAAPLSLVAGIAAAALGAGFVAYIWRDRARSSAGRG